MERDETLEAERQSLEAEPRSTRPDRSGATLSLSGSTRGHAQLDELPRFAWADPSGATLSQALFGRLNVR